MNLPKLHLWNPQNDLALAADVSGYTPPKNVKDFIEAGRLLPVWWADEGDYILGDKSLQYDADRMSEIFGLPRVKVVRGVQKDCIPMPWGWSSDAAHQFARAGIDEMRLPLCDLLRSISHRATAMRINEQLGVESALEMFDINGFNGLYDRFPGGFVLKSPWSGSGRGVIYSNKVPEKQLMAMAEGIIRRQGSVTVERLYAKQKDFGALFELNDGKAEFAGLSYFYTSDTGAYKGSYLMDDGDIIKSLGIDPMPVIRSLETVLSQYTEYFPNGMMGVDMLTYRDNGQLCIAPCIEVNWRMTMGVVALKIHRHLQRDGIFKVLPGRCAAEALDLLPTSQYHGFSFSLTGIV